MAKTFTLEVVTPDKVVLRDELVVSLIVPAAEGYLGVMAGHAPLFGELKVGEITVRHEDDSEIHLSTCGGFIEVADHRATLLVDAAEFTYEIDVERAEKAKSRAEQLLARTDLLPEETARARASLERALNRLRLAGRTQ